jgi:branched-chain amino acid transport system substrate-binding protein
MTIERICSPATNPARRRLLTGFVATGALGALSFAVPTRAQAGVLKVGCLLPLSGGLGAYGLQTKRGSDLGVRVLQEASARFEVHYADTASDAAAGATAVERLVRGGCTLLVGAWDSATTLVAARAAETARVPLIVNIAAAPAITAQGLAYVFRNFPTATQLVGNALDAIAALPRSADFAPKRAVLMHVDDTFGQGIAAELRARWNAGALGMALAATVSYDARARDFAAEVGKAKATQADVLCLVSRVDDAVAIVREMAKQAFEPLAIVGPAAPAGYEQGFADALGAYADDYLACVPWLDFSQPMAKRVLRWWQQLYPNLRMELNAGFGFEGMLVAVEALRRARSTRPDDLREALRHTNIENHIMLGAPIRFDRDGQNNGIASALVQIRERRALVVAPHYARQADVRLPMRKWRERSAGA